MNTNFKYKTLHDPAHEIRLLQITCSSPLTYQTSVHKLEIAPTYRAISYVWGDATEVATIRIDEWDLPVRRNCICALRQACRHFPIGTYVWLDAICINQEDVEEKSHQVAMMGRIYYNAKSVLTSVGEHADDSEHLYDIAALLRARVVERNVECPRCDEMPARSMYSLEQRRIEVIEAHAYHSWVDGADDDAFERLAVAYRRFANRPYWSRIWIIQENMLARHIDIACGDRLDRLGNICFVMRLLKAALMDRYSLFFDKAPGRLTIQLEEYEDWSVQDHLRFLWYSGGLHDAGSRSNPRDLVKFVRIMQEYGSAEVHDRVYALLGVIEWGNKGPPKPDYRLAPFTLALQVLERMTEGNGCRSFFFPRSMSHLFKALAIDSMEHGHVDAHCPQQRLPRAEYTQCCCTSPVPPRISFVYEQRQFRQLVIEAPEMSTTGKGGVMPYDWQGPAAQEPSSYATELERAMELYSLLEGDIILGLKTYERRILESECFCLILRVINDGYYELLDGLPRLSTDNFPEDLEFDPERGTIRDTRQNQNQLWLCLSLDDAAYMTLTIDRLEARVASRGSMVDERHSLLNADHKRQRMSSYAVVGESEREEPLKINGTPSADGKSLPCAQCGGLFRPDRQK